MTGDLPVFFPYRTETGGKRPLVQYHHIKTGHRSGLHWHDFFELEWIISGTGCHVLDNERAPLAPGCAYILIPNHFHAIQADSAMEVINFSFDRTAISEEIMQVLLRDGARFADFSADAPFYGRLAQMAVTEYGTKNAFGARIARDILEILLTQILCRSTECPRIPMATPVQNAVTELQAHFREPITLQSVAQKLYVTPNYLGRIFTQEIGQTFRTYLCMMRLRYSCDLLSATELSMQEIASASGFQSAEYFGAVFRKIMHQTPAAYRRNTGNRAVSD